MTNTPFLDLLKELPDPKEVPTHVWTPLAFLYPHHKAMLEFHQDYEELREKEGYEEAFLESVFVKNKYVLDYVSFVSCLNQLGRALKKIDANLRIPRELRVRFFRNVVVEHWDDYVAPTISGSFSVIYPGPDGYPQINVFTEHVAEERKLLRDQIDEVFKQYGIVLDMNGYGEDIWRDPDNIEKLYVALEKLPHWPNSKDPGPVKELAKLLFRFGLPGPICNINEYSEELFTQLRGHHLFPFLV